MRPRGGEPYKSFDSAVTGGTPLRPLDAALAYAAKGWPVFPTAIIDRQKVPLCKRGLLDASTDPEIITRWWTRRPRALITIATGASSGIVILDIDTKYSDQNGFDTLDALGFSALPDTPISHTPSGGVHLHFAAGDREFRNTGGARGRGLGPGLDWPAWGGACVMPTPGSRYWWDPVANFDTVPLAPVPAKLRPAEPVRHQECDRPSTSNVDGLSLYGEIIIDLACREIIGAPGGAQEITLNGECFSIGTLVASGEAPEWFARKMLMWAAVRMPDHDPHRPWVHKDLEKKVDAAFEAGLRRPRSVRRGR